MQDTAESKTLPAGTYIVGDPCYSFESQEDWMGLLESGGLHDKPMPRIMECEVPEKGLSFVASGTAYGDGRYEDQFGNSYPVDAGLIGVVPTTTGKTLDEDWKSHVIEFDSPFTVAYEDGMIKIGHLKIETGDAEDYEDEDQYEDEEELEIGEDDE